MATILQQRSDSHSDFIDAGSQSAGSRLAEFVRSSVDQARLVEEPFFHLEFDRVFPSDVYKTMLANMPSASDYRPMSGRVKTSGENPTRVKIDLFPEYLRHVRAEKRQIWQIVGRALCSPAVKESFIRRLAPGLSRRFGPEYAKVGFYPIPILTRDIAGYSISPHTDTSWKGITVQFYLPPDESAPHVGTVFHSKQPDGSLTRRSQMRFAPNTGYAFAVADDTWHSADEVGREVKSRDSILLTYFVDAGLLRILRNRSRRFGNYLRNEVRHLSRSG
jgi:hypothetical protein